MRIEFSPDAEQDLEQIGDYIAQGSSREAVRFLRKLRAEIHLIGEGPLRFQLRPDIGPDARLVTVGRYVILFRVAGPLVRIERVLAGNRDLPQHF